MTRIHRRDGETDVADHARGKPGIARELRPVFASIARLEDAASRTARHELPWCPPRLPECRVERLRIPGVHDQIGYAGGVVPLENLPPALAAVRGLVNSALPFGFEDV